MDLVGFDFEAASQNSISYVTSMAASAAYSAAAMVNFDTTVEGFPETELPVWIMGRSYSAIHDLDDLFDEVLSRLWFSYRKDFPEIGQSGFTSDRGWGCMLRCGQMVVAECLQRLSFGRDFRWRAQPEDKLPDDYFQILAKFSDQKTSVFSIHQIALMSESTENRPVGNWFGPNAVAQSIKRLSTSDDSKFGLNVQVALDNLVIIDQVKVERPWRPLLLFIPLRLGLCDINPLYFNDLKTIFEFEECVGVIGGRPNHALYFIGVVGDELLSIDPHVTQQAQNKVTQEDTDADATFHTDKCHRIDLKNVDPSLSLCFFCVTEESFDRLCLSLSARLIRGHATPMFEIREKAPPLFQDEFSTGDERCQDPPTGSDDDEFEIL